MGKQRTTDTKLQIFWPIFFRLFLNHPGMVLTSSEGTTQNCSRMPIQKIAIQNIECRRWQFENILVRKMCIGNICAEQILYLQKMAIKTVKVRVEEKNLNISKNKNTISYIGSA